MVREDEVAAPTVEVVLWAKEFFRDRRVFDVPTRSAFAKLGFPDRFAWFR